MKACLFTFTTLLGAFAKVDSSCFMSAADAVGGKIGQPFSDSMILNSLTMTVETRISQVDVCTDLANSTISGLQLTVTDTATQKS
jgi:hypothetical protein